MPMPVDFERRVEVGGVFYTVTRKRGNVGVKKHPDSTATHGQYLGNSQILALPADHEVRKLHNILVTGGVPAVT